MPALFISDLHLSQDVPEVTRAFFRFLQNEATQVDALYILGDLFEVWIGDDDPNSLNREVIRELKKLSDTGTELFFQHGNRDFLIGRQFAKETGCTLLPDTYHARIDGRQVLLLHGDTLCTHDKSYQRFRRIVRNPLFTGLFGRLPLKRRRKIAADLRSKSLSANSNKAENIMDVTPQEVEKLLIKHKVDTMIHGHTHRPARHQHAHGERIVLGDWHTTGWSLRVSKKTMELIEFPIKLPV